MNNTRTSRINDAITRLLGEQLKQFNDKTLDLVTCIDIYQTIFNSLVEVFETSELKLSNEAMNYLAQQYYDAILINNTQELDPNIFTQRAKIENIVTKELALLALMFQGTDFALPLIVEIKHRS